MERRNVVEEKEEKDYSSSYWGFPTYHSSQLSLSLSPVSSISSVLVPTMAENHHHLFNQFMLPSYDDETTNNSLTPLNPAALSHLNQPPIANPCSLISDFNRLNLSNHHYNNHHHVSQSNPSSLINRPTAVIDNPLIDPYAPINYGYLIEELRRKNEMIRQLQLMNQGLKPFNVGGGGGGGVYDQNLLNNHSSDPYSKFLTGGGGEIGKCYCSDCLKGGSYPKDYRRSSNGLQRCYKGDNLDDLNYFNRLQIYNSQVHQLMNQPRFNSLEEVRGIMVATAKDQHGCRFLQKKIEGGRKEDIEMILVEIKDYISELMVDQFGNYLVQKLLDVCNAEQRHDILISITRNEHVLHKICRDMHGTRAVQKLLERLTNEHQQARFIAALTTGTFSLIIDTNGHHVIQYCVKNFPDKLKMYLLNEVAARCLDIAQDRSGCCVLQLCVEHSHGETKECLVNEITRNALSLSQHEYGNYVVQFLLGMNNQQYTSKLLRQLEGSYISLSMQKYSSNVVERCLKESSEEQATQIVKELINSPDSLKLFQDAYGNYVIQSALNKMATFKTPAFFAMVDLVKMQDTSLRSHPYGKRILAKVEQLIK
ncbi:hypothetical protein AQUCO_04200053v1 [Aquilegia coerulea]|uniref:PUM-HD domain-containing protein n=1 Tax=Aquilegia coerulea TaxID=218851 RepID=A0A2G5CP51_AQUCA|nr:hypothetical protein AQUCO_04200053v1 [Aquilegia coerulea]